MGMFLKFIDLNYQWQVYYPLSSLTFSSVNLSLLLLYFANFIQTWHLLWFAIHSQTSCPCYFLVHKVVILERKKNPFTKSVLLYLSKNCYFWLYFFHIFLRWFMLHLIILLLLHVIIILCFIVMLRHSTLLEHCWIALMPFWLLTDKMGISSDVTFIGLYFLSCFLQICLYRKIFLLSTAYLL